MVLIDQIERVRTADAIEVSLLVDEPLNTVWRWLTQRVAIEALLGKGAVLGGKGEPWRADDGTHGVLRSYHPSEQMRMSWHAGEDTPATLIDLQTVPEGDGTHIWLRHEHLYDSLDSERLLEHWVQALREVARGASSVSKPADGDAVVPDNVSSDSDIEQSSRTGGGSQPKGGARVPRDDRLLREAARLRIRARNLESMIEASERDIDRGRTRSMEERTEPSLETPRAGGQGGKAPRAAESDNEEDEVQRRAQALIQRMEELAPTLPHGL